MDALILLIGMLDSEDGSISRFTLHGDRSLVQLNDPMCNGKAQAGASQSAAACFIDPVEAFENYCLIFGSNSNSRIFDAHYGAAVLLFR